MPEKPLNELTHEELSRIWEEDPGKFREIRRDLIEETIQKARPENQSTLRQSQREIDGTIWKAKNPLGACYALYPTMIDSFLELNDKLQEFAGEKT